MNDTSTDDEREALIDPESLDALEALAKGATPGSWEAGDAWVYTLPVYPDDNRLSNVLGMKFADEERADAERERGLANASFIAAADPSMVLALIDALRRSEALRAAGRCAMSREVDDALIDRIVAAVAGAGVSRAIVEYDWPECHKTKCQARHGDPDTAMGHMKHQIIEAVKLELRYEATTRPDVAVDGDAPEDAAALTLGVLLHRYRPEASGTYAKAAQLIVDAYPEIVPALAGGVR